MLMAPKRKRRGNTFVTILVTVLATLFGTLVVLSVLAQLNRQREEATPRERVAWHESAAIGDLQNIAWSAAMYHDLYHRYPRSLAELGPAISRCGGEDAANFIDSRLASGTENGYVYSFETRTSQDSEAGFEVHADPVSTREGVRHFYVDETRVIRWSNTLATSSSPAVE